MCFSSIGARGSALPIVQSIKDSVFPALTAIQDSAFMLYQQGFKKDALEVLNNSVYVQKKKDFFNQVQSFIDRTDESMLANSGLSRSLITSFEA